VNSTTNVSEIISGQLPKFDGNKTEWVTDASVPDPDPLPEITGYNLLIRPVEVQKDIKVAGGGKIILPGSFTEDVKFLTNIGQVKAVGPLAFKDPNVKPSDGTYFPYGRYQKPWRKVGDYVVWGKHQGTKILVKGVAFVLLQDELILMTVKDPGDINPILNALNRG